MKQTVLPLFLLLLLLPSGSAAQQWNEEQRAVLDHIKSCWVAWEQAVEKQDLEVWLETCRPAEDYSMWWTNLASPIGLEHVRRSFDTFINLKEKYLSLEPVAVKIHGDTALVQFFGYWQPVVDGKPVTTQYKRTEVYVRRDGRWQFIGGQGSPVSSQDADPYE